MVESLETWAAVDPCVRPFNHHHTIQRQSLSNMPDFDSDPYFEYKCRRVNDPVELAMDLGIPLEAPGTYRPQEGAIESARKDLRNLFADADDADSSAIEKLILRDTKLKATRSIWLSTLNEKLDKLGHLPLVSSWAIFRAFEAAEVIGVYVEARCNLPRPTSLESLEYRNLNRLGFTYTVAHRQRRDELRTTRNVEFVQPRFTTGIALFQTARSQGAQQGNSVGGPEVDRKATGSAQAAKEREDHTKIAGQTDSKTDIKYSSVPRDEQTRKAIQYVNRHRGKVANGKAQYMSLSDLIKEFARDRGEKEVERLSRALRPDRHGDLLQPDK